LGSEGRAFGIAVDEQARKPGRGNRNRAMGTEEKQLKDEGTKK